MTPINRCPDCGKTIAEKAKRCTCGWIIFADKKNHDDQCHYVEFGERCGKEGTICKSIRGNKWYCIKHWYFTERE